MFVAFVRLSQCVVRCWVDRCGFGFRSRQYGNTPLHTAAYLGHLAIAERLLEEGAPVDAENLTGSTPMHLAAEGGHLAVIERLLEAGAQADLPNNVRFLLRMFSCQVDQQVLSNLLLACVCIAAAGQDAAARGVLVRPSRCGPAARGSRHRHQQEGHMGKACALNALCMSTGEKRMSTASCKLCEGFLFSCVQGGFTPLHLAVLSGHVDIVHILLEAGVDVTVRDGVIATGTVLC